MWISRKNEVVMENVDFKENIDLFSSRDYRYVNHFKYADKAILWKYKEYQKLK